MASPLRALHQDLRRKLAESGPRSVLAKKARFSHPQALDTQLRLDRVSCTPLLVGRLTALATIIGYTGPICENEPTTPNEVATTEAVAR